MVEQDYVRCAHKTTKQMQGRDFREQKALRVLLLAIPAHEPLNICINFIELLKLFFY